MKRATASSGNGRIPPTSSSPAAAPAEIWIPAQIPQKRPSLFLYALFAAGLLLVSGALAGAAVFAWFYTSDLILPGVRVMDIPLSLQTPAQAAVTLQAEWRTQTIRLESDAQSWTAAPDELGLLLDADKTAAVAYAQGRSLDSWLTLAADGLQLQPAWRFEPEMAAAHLETLSGAVAVPAVDAGVRIAGGQVEVVEPVNGRALNIAASVDQIAQNPAQVLRDGRLALVIEPVAPAVTDVSAVAAKARQLLATAITLRAYDPVRDESVVWTIAPETWGAWLSLRMDASVPDGFAWELDAGAAEAYLANRSETLGGERYLKLDEVVTAVSEAINNQSAAVSTRIYHHPRQHVVAAGESMASIGYAYGIPYPWVQQANPGVESLAPGQVITIPSPDEMLPLPVVENKRIVVSISEQRVWAYENGQLKWDWPASTGIDSSPTSPGIFQVQSHEVNAYAANWDLWMPHFIGIYRPVPTSEFMNGFHGFPTRGGSTLLWTADLGRQVTYGCVLISSDNAAQLYDWADAGVVVEIRP